MLVHVMKPTVEVQNSCTEEIGQLHALLNFLLERTPRLCGPQSRPGRIGDDGNILFPPALNPAAWSLNYPDRVSSRYKRKLAVCQGGHDRNCARSRT